MSNTWFYIDRYSQAGERYKVSINSDNYVGLNHAITGGTGNTYYIAGDKREYLQNSMAITLTDTGVGTTAATVTSFTYNSGSDRTEILTSVAYDAANDTISADAYIPEIELDGIVGSISYDREGDPLHENLKTSQYTFSVYNGIGAPFTESRVFNDEFLSAFNSGTEEDYKCKLEIWDGSSWVLEWAGCLIQDGLTIDNIDSPRKHTFKAIDGIGRLKGIRFAEAVDASYTEQNTFLTYLQDILAYNGLEEFWGASDNYIAESIAIEEASITYGSSTSNLVVARTSKYVFVNDTKNPIEPYSCYDCLTAILDIFQSQIIHTKGCYYIQPIRRKASATQPIRYFYKGSTAVESTNTSANNTVTCAGASGGAALRAMEGKFMKLPGLRRVAAYGSKVDIGIYDVMQKTNTPLEVWRRLKNGQNSNNLDYDFPVTSSHFSVSGSGTFETYDIGTIRGGSSTGRAIEIDVITEQDPTYNNNVIQGYYLEILIQIKCGTYRIKDDLYTNPQWTTTSTDYAIYNVYPHTPGSTNHFRLTTPEIPFTEETSCTIDVYYTVRPKGGHSVSPSTSGTMWLIKDMVIYYPTDGDEDDGKMFYADNPTEGYSEVITLDSLIIVDQWGVSSKQAIEVFDGSAWDEATAWDGGFDATYYLTKLRTLEYLSLQRKPLWTTNMTFEGDYTPWKSITYTFVDDVARYWFMNGCTWDIANDEWSGEWIEIAQTKTGISVGTFDNPHVGGTNPQAPFGAGSETTLLMMENQDQITVTNERLTVAGGSRTTINIIATGDDGLVRDDDELAIIHPTTGTIMDTVTVNGDLTSAATTLTVDSYTPAVDCPPGCILMHLGNARKYGYKMRGSYFEYVDGITTPTSDSDTGAMDDKTILFSGDAIYVRNGSTVYRYLGNDSWSA